MHNGPHPDTAPLAILGRGSVVPIVARAGDWVQVKLADGAEGRPAWLGWAPEAGLQVSTSAPRRDAITGLFEHEPPAIDLDEAVITTLHTDAKTWPLNGVARFAGAGHDRRHVVVFRGEDKVFFRSGRFEPGARSDLPFSTSIKLSPGRNVVRILVREGEDDVTGRTVIVYRR